MANEDLNDRQAPQGQSAAAPATAGSRLGNFVDAINQKFAYIVGLPIVTVLGGGLVGHFDYLSSYQEKVKIIGKEQVTAAETVFANVSGKFSKAITLQQILYFNYRDAIKANIDGDARALETKNARGIFKQYDDLRTELRESVDLLARRVEIDLDWASNIGRDAATAGAPGGDPMSRLALGRYDFDCDDDKYMPSYEPGKTQVNVPPPADILKSKPGTKPLGIDWYSAKHQLLTLYYCFDLDHRKITVVRQWAADSPVDDKVKQKFIEKLGDVQDSFDREAVRLHSFMSLAARRIEGIRIKFRPSRWYCHVPLVREIIDRYSRRCMPIRTALHGSPS